MKVPGTEAIANEWGCSVGAGSVGAGSVGAGDVTASAWVFATPVGETRAREWVRAAGRGDCTRKDVPEIGSPGWSSPARTGAASTRRTRGSSATHGWPAG